MPNPITEVIVRKGVERLGRFTLVPGEYLIGRDPDCHIRVDSPEVSLHHARLVIGDDELQLEDLGSSNGCFIGEVRVRQPIRLQPPQQIKLGTQICQ